MANSKRPEPIDIHVGSRVHLCRKTQGMSQQKLGQSLGITFQQVQKYEKGTNRISASRLQHIAELLSVPVSFFFEDALELPLKAAGSNETAPPDYVADFLSSSDSFKLNMAFVRIKDAKLRQAVIDLVEAIGDRDG